MSNTETLSKPRGLTCACCGEYTRGRQWWNRDTGYGVCPSCYQDEVKRNGEETAIDYYGKPGVHHSLEDLTSFRVHLSNGTSYVTSMAKDITLEDAKRYFIGRIIEAPDEKHNLTFVNVEQVTT